MSLRWADLPVEMRQEVAYWLDPISARALGCCGHGDEYETRELTKILPKVGVCCRRCALAKDKLWQDRWMEKWGGRAGMRMGPEGAADWLSQRAAPGFFSMQTDGAIATRHGEDVHKMWRVAGGAVHPGYLRNNFLRVIDPMRALRWAIEYNVEVLAFHIIATCYRDTPPPYEALQDALIRNRPRIRNRLVAAGGLFNRASPRYVALRTARAERIAAPPGPDDNQEMTERDIDEEMED